MKSDVDITVTEASSEGGGPCTPEQHSHNRRYDAGPDPSLKNRLGTISAILFFSSALVVLGGMAFISFVWFSGPENSRWRAIIVNDWATRAVSFTSVGIRWAVSFQTGTSMAMLAALALESYYVPHPDVAAVSMMRIGGSGLVGVLRDLILPLIRKGPRSNPSMWSVVGTALGVLATSSLLQFTSTALLSDLIIQPVIEAEHPATAAIDYSYTMETVFASPPDVTRTYNLSTYYNFDTAGFTNKFWSGHRPSSYPPFGEWVNSSAQLRSPNLSDTGPTVRAFLPFDDADRRQRLATYHGVATVFDSRVTCIRPTIANYSWLVDEAEPESDRYPYLVGDVSVQNIPNHVNAPKGLTRFSCAGVLDPVDEEDDDKGMFVRGFSLCQLPNRRVSVQDYNESSHVPSTPVQGGLYSEFRESAMNASGAAFLIVTSSRPKGPEWETIASIPAALGDDPLYTENVVDVSLTLCYAAMDTANRNIIATGVVNRTEATTQRKDYGYDYSPVVHQLLPGSSRDRGVLDLQLDSTAVNGSRWAQPYSTQTGNDGPALIYGDLPFLAKVLNFVAYDSRTTGLHSDPGNYTLFLDVEGFMADATTTTNFGGVHWSVAGQWVAKIFAGVLAQDSAARALQAVLTSVARNAYYDPDYFDLYNKTVPYSASYFGNHYAPARTYNVTYFTGPGLRNKKVHQTTVPPFFTVVAVVLAVHHCLVAAIFWSFWRGTRLSRLGDPWQAVAHVVLGSESSAVLETSASMHADRSAVEKVMKASGATKVCVGIAADADRIVTLRRSETR